MVLLHDPSAPTRPMRYPGERNSATLHAGTQQHLAFCATCPPLEEVMTLLQGLGFRLAFQMQAEHRRAYMHLAELPAQSHFCDGHGTEVIYLAGRDVTRKPWMVPAHQSCFFVSPGSNTLACVQSMQMLSATWSLTWEHVEN